MHQCSRICLEWHLWIMLFISIEANFCNAFSPSSRAQLKSAVDACLKVSPRGKCSRGSHGPIGTWDVSRVSDMSRMFAHARLFDSDVSKWDVSRVKDMRGMFLGATSFNGELSRWDVSRVSDMHGMFLGATVFKRQLCGSAWVHSRAKQGFMFEGSAGSISSTACSMSTKRVFSPKSKDELKMAVEAYTVLASKSDNLDDVDFPDGPIEEWDVSRVTNMSSVFANVGLFNGDISSWDVSRVTDMSNMFLNATSFDGDISRWDVSRVTDMYAMFWGAESFNGDISKWDVSRVTDTMLMFCSATLFRGDLSKWDVSRVTDMCAMFGRAKSFNNDISKWDVSNVVDMHDMFWSAVSFDRNISKWDVSKVTNMMFMFYEAAAFTQELCTPAWVHSKATKTMMFLGSDGAIPVASCENTTSKSSFSPQSKDELKDAVDSCQQKN